MKTHTPAGCIPATNAKKSTGPIGTRPNDRATVTIELESKDLSDRSRRLILARAEEWQCSPGEAVARLLDVIVANLPAPASTHHRVPVEVDRELWEEVRELLLSPDGIATFGVVSLEERFSEITDTWLRNVTCALSQGSGYRRAAGLAPLVKGGGL